PIPSDMLAGLLQRFARVAVASETPVDVPSETESVDAPPHPSLSPASGGKGARAERSAAEEAVPSLANGEGRAPSAPGTGDGIVPSAGDNAPRSEDGVMSPPARNDTRRSEEHTSELQSRGQL